MIFQKEKIFSIEFKVKWKQLLNKTNKNNTKKNNKLLMFKIKINT